MGANIPPPKSFNPPQSFGSSVQNNMTQQAQAAPAIPQASFLPLNPPAATPAAQAPDPTQAASDPISQTIAQYRASQAGVPGRGRQQLLGL